MRAMSVGCNGPLRWEGARLPSRPVRIASLVPATTEILTAIGLDDSIVARSHECAHPSAPAVTSSAIDSTLPASAIDRAVTSLNDAHTIYTLHSEALAKSAPDIVFTQDLCEVCAADRRAVEACSLPTGTQVHSSDPSSLDDVLDSIIDVAAAVGQAEKGRALAARLRSRLHWVDSVVADLDAPRVAVIEWPDPIFTAGHWVPEMVEAAGGISVFGTKGESSRPATMEELAAARPDVVVIAFCGFDLYEGQARFKELIAQPGFAESTRFARTFAMDGGAFFSAPGPGLVDGVELMAWSLHRPSDRLRPPVGRGAKLIEAGWVDVASLPVTVNA